MTNREILSHVDHTLLKTTATWEQIEQLCREAIEFNTASVCIPPSYIAQVREAFPELRICTVVGFPNGYNTTETKVFEAKDAIEKGADEIDMVINRGWVKDKLFDQVTEEIKAVKAVCKGKILKVIIETCDLTELEIAQISINVSIARPQYIKTSTGFGAHGATPEAIEIMKGHSSRKVLIKAAGGIRSREDMVKYLEMGCDRLGTSSAVSLLKDAADEE